jgi:hypothetical protein
MKSSRRLGAACAVALALLAPLGHAPAQSTPPPGDEPRRLDADPPGTEKSPSPKAAEWASASKVKLTRVGPAASGCIAYKVREWLRVRCPIKTFAVSLLGGSGEGVAFWIGPEAEQQPGEVQFPMRRGDRRVVEFWTYGKDAAGSFMPEPAFLVQEQWVDGEAAPTVTAL